MPGLRTLAVLATAAGLVLPAVCAARAPGRAAAVQAHSMIHTCCTPEREREHLVAQAKASGAGIVRLDVEVHGIVHPTPSGYGYDFSKLDEVVALGRRHGIRILGILSGTPAGLGDCPAGTQPEEAWKCGPADPYEYARHVVAIMEHAGTGVYAWEFWNEPDERYMYTGSPEAYGRALGAIHERSAGRFLITAGGIADLAGGLRFLRRAIAAGARFDIANVHIRGTGVRTQTRRAARFFGDLPLWVTEHGYPSHPAPADQVSQLRRSLPALRAGGADQVFVTLRDIDEFGPDSPFASEGILGKPAWDLVVSLNRRAGEARTPRRRTLRLHDNYFMNPSCTAKLRMCEFRAQTKDTRSTEWEQSRYRLPKKRRWSDEPHARRSVTCPGGRRRTCRSPSGSRTVAGSASWGVAPGGGSATG
jgi:hypothetical protein